MIVSLRTCERNICRARRRNRALNQWKDPRARVLACSRALSAAHSFTAQRVAVPIRRPFPNPSSVPLTFTRHHSLRNALNKIHAGLETTHAQESRHNLEDDR